MFPRKILMIIVLAGVPLSLHAEKMITFILQTGSSYTISGFHEREYGDIDNPTLEETEYLPGFYMSQLQVAIGRQINESLYLGFMIGGWLRNDFSSYAVTNASLYTKYAFIEKDWSPILSFQGGLFMEEFPDSYLGFVINPAFGIELNRSQRLPLHITLGYLLTFYFFEGTDPGNEDYLNNEGELRHGISLTAGFSF